MNNLTLTDNTPSTKNTLSRQAYLRYLIRQQGTLKQFANKIDIPYGTLLLTLKNIDGSSMNNILKICNGLGISLQEINKYSEYTLKDENLTLKEEIDLIGHLEELFNDIDTGKAFALSDNPIEDEIEKTMIKRSLFDAVLYAKKKAKERFTPKKYRK